jgi:uncharacterized protein (TIGR02145 family)
VYETTQIGDRIWMSEDLKSTHFQDGSALKLYEQNEKEKFHESMLPSKSIDFDDVYSEETGGYIQREYHVYNSKALLSEKNICPYGFKVPDDIDIEELFDEVNPFGLKAKIKGRKVVKGLIPNTNSDKKNRVMPLAINRLILEGSNEFGFNLDYRSLWVDRRNVEIDLKYSINYINSTLDEINIWFADRSKKKSLNNIDTKKGKYYTELNLFDPKISEGNLNAMYNQIIKTMDFTVRCVNDEFYKPISIK